MAPPEWAFQVENFVTEPDEELICSICHAVFCDPTLCPCDHVFCKICITKWLQSNQNCPICRKQVSNDSIKQAVPIVSNLIMKLRINCQKKSLGCRAQFSLESSETHMKECEFEFVQCKNKPCKDTLYRKDIIEHETKNCPYRSMQCPTCFQNMHTSAVGKEHNCVKTLLMTIQKKNNLIHIQRSRIKQLEDENKKLKEMQNNGRSNLFSENTNNLPSTISPDEITINIHEFDSRSSDNLSTFPDDSIPNDNEESDLFSAYMDNGDNESNAESQTIDIDPLSLHYNRASTSHGRNGNLASENGSTFLEVLNSVFGEDGEPTQQRSAKRRLTTEKPAKRKHHPSLVSTTTTSDEEEADDYEEIMMTMKKHFSSRKDNQQSTTAGTSVGTQAGCCNKNNAVSLRQSAPQMPISILPVSHSPGQQSSSNIVSVSGPTVSTPALTADPEKRRLIRQQLVILLHAHKCQRRENQSNVEAMLCTLPHCRTMKLVLRHMASCFAGKQCPIPHCSSSRQIITHWKKCRRCDCPVCSPLKQASDRQQQRVNHQAPQSQNLNHIPTQQTAQNPQSQVLSSLLLQNSSTDAIRSQFAQNFLLADNLQPEVEIENAFLMTAPPVLPWALPNNPTVVKDWQQSVTQDLRHHLVQKIIQDIFPNTGISTLQDTRMINLVAYVREIERGIYSTANSREEYDQLIAETLHKIQKELEEKRQERREFLQRKK